MSTEASPSGDILTTAVGYQVQNSQVSANGGRVRLEIVVLAEGPAPVKVGDCRPEIHRIGISGFPTVKIVSLRRPHESEIGQR